MKKLIKNVEGFDIYFEALEEYDFDGSYWEPDDFNNVFQKIESGELVLFCAKVTAEKSGIILSDDYLGCCIYESYEQFYTTEGDYFDDMVNVVINDAKKHLNGEIEKQEQLLADLKELLV